MNYFQVFPKTNIPTFVVNVVKQSICTRLADAELLYQLIEFAILNL